MFVLACGRSEFAQISDTPAGAYETSLAAFDDGFVAAWYDTRDDDGQIYVRAVDANGRPASAERRLTNSRAAAYEPDIQPLSNNFVVGWYDKATNGHLTPHVAAFSRAGELLWMKTPSAVGRNTVVRTASGLVFVAWVQDEADDRAGVWAAWYRADGVDLIAPRRIANAGKTTWNLNAAMDPGASPGHPDGWIAFDAKAGTRAEEIFLVSTGEKDSRVMRLTPDDGIASKYPDFAFAPASGGAAGHAAMTWFDRRDGNEEVYLSVGPTSAFSAAGDLEAVRVTSTPGHSVGAYLAWNADRVGLSWCDDSEGNHEVYFQPFDSNGQALGRAEQLTRTRASSWVPAIRAWRSGFAMAWNEREGTDDDAHGGPGRSQVVFRIVP